MQNPITRTKNFVHKHRYVLTGTAGVAVGSALTYKLLKSRTFHVELGTTVEDLQALLDKPNSAIAWTIPKLGEIVLIQENHPQYS